MQFARGIAQGREHLARQGDRRVAAVHRLGQRLALHVLHDHDAALACGITLHDAGKVQEPAARALGAPDALVSAPKALALKELAHVGSLLGAVRPHEVDALGRLERAALQHGVDAIALVARKGAEMFFEFVGHDGTW